MIELEIKFYGAFRKYEDHSAPLYLSVESPASVKKIKNSLKEALQSRVSKFLDEDLLDDSALATQTRVLAPGDSISDSCVLSILPPVCGG